MVSIVIMVNMVLNFKEESVTRRPPLFLGRAVALAQGDMASAAGSPPPQMGREAATEPQLPPAQIRVCTQTSCVVRELELHPH